MSDPVTADPVTSVYQIFARPLSAEAGETTVGDEFRRLQFLAQARLSRLTDTALEPAIPKFLEEADKRLSRCLGTQFLATPIYRLQRIERSLAHVVSLTGRYASHEELAFWNRLLQGLRTFLFNGPITVGADAICALVESNAISKEEGIALMTMGGEIASAQLAAIEGGVTLGKDLRTLSREEAPQAFKAALAMFDGEVVPQFIERRRALLSAIPSKLHFLATRFADSVEAVFSRRNPLAPNLFVGSAALLIVAVGYSVFDG